MSHLLRRVAGALAVLVLGPIAALAASTPAQAAVTYHLPWTAGKSFRVTQGPDGTYSHMSKYSRHAVDFGMPTGTPVLASAPGTVLRAGSASGWGNMVLIQHADGQCTIYAHLSVVKTSKGAKVGGAATIGLSGSTGRSSGPHLHWGHVSCDDARPVGTATPNTVEVGRNFYVGQTPVSSNKPGSTPPPAGKHTGVIATKGGVPLTTRKGPGTNYAAVGTLPSGTTVTIVCQTTGTTVDGLLGKTNIWDKLSDGRYVSDTYVRTGSDGMVAPRC